MVAALEELTSLLVLEQLLKMIQLENHISREAQKL